MISIPTHICTGYCFLEKLVRKTIIVDECWIYTGQKTSVNNRPIFRLIQYGTGYNLGKAVYIHLYRQPKLWVLHTCDNGRCWNPNHLYDGSAARNSYDAINNGRRNIGSKVNTAKLTEADIPIIRQMLRENIRVRKIADRFGVLPLAIYDIKSGRTWRRVV